MVAQNISRRRNGEARPLWGKGTHLSPHRISIPASDTELLLLKQLIAEPTHIDEICHYTGLPISTVSSTLAIIELNGLVKQAGTMNYVLAREVRQEYRVRID